MDIDQDYLANIFEGDLLYIFQDENQKANFDINKESSSNTQVKEPQSELNTPVDKDQPSHKEVVILVNQNLGEKEKETLNKLLKAINIEEGQYQIIQDHPDQLKSIQHLKLFLSFHSQYVQSSEYEILKINKGNAIYAHDLAELNRDSSKKLMLWNLLKTIV